MPRRQLRRISRQYRKNQSAWYLRPFAAVLHHPRYFAVNRRSVSMALAIGVFVSMLPAPGHTPLAVLIALALGVNIGVAAIGAWVNTPLTMIPVFWFEYRLGAWLLGIPVQDWPDEVSWQWLQTQLGLLWKPLFAGAALTASVTAALVYFGVSALWRWSAGRKLRQRRARRNTR